MLWTAIAVTLVVGMVVSVCFTTRATTSEWHRTDRKPSRLWKSRVCSTCLDILMAQMRGYEHRSDQARQSVRRLSGHDRDGPQRRQKSTASGVWETLSDRRRSRIAKNTARARWSTKKKPAA
jgi:hypothetical protein